MIKERFRASVQYGDFFGTVAADRSDAVGPDGWLENQRLKSSDEFVLGVEIYVGENPGRHQDPITVHFLLVDGGFDDVDKLVKSSTEIPLKRRVTVEMPAVDFLALFKRFSISMSPGGMLSDK